MNPRIQQLPEELVAKIAAGEVIERPASVLKELIENSLDAQATDISIDIEGAGRAKMVISDNGCGMSKDDLHLAIRRHATSKISTLEDLEKIATFGFRGEALPSVAAVSRLKIVSRSVTDPSGWEIELEGGKIKSEKPVARDVGTTIEVRDLFFNTPARFKFLKADSTERSACLRTIEEIAFAAPAVSFKVNVEKNKPIIFPSHDLSTPEKKQLALKARLWEAWGAKFAKGMENLNVAEPHVAISGIVSNTAQHQATSRQQVLYINRRPVQNRRLTRAVYDGYRGQLPSGRHPAWVIFLDINPQAIDVNVHPAKKEVKISFENEIYGMILRAVQKSLFKSEEFPVGAFENKANFSVDLANSSPGAAPAPLFPPTTSRPAADPTNPSIVTAIRELYRTIPQRDPFSAVAQNSAESLQVERSFQQDELAGMRNKKFKALAQVGQLFILAEEEEGVVIVDQHAAHEKVIYEKLFQNSQSQAPDVQLLLVPFSWEVSASTSAQVQGHIHTLNKLGFIIDPFGGNSFLIKGYPRGLGDKFDLHSLLDGLSDVLGESSGNASGPNFEHRLSSMAACKAAVKAGDSLDLRECQGLLEELVKCEAPFTCPHGRPTLIRLPFVDLERKFRRS